MGLKSKYTAVLFIVILFVETACNSISTHKHNQVQDDKYLIHALFDSLSEAIIFDGFSPPVASRIYAYCAVAAYSSVIYDEDEFQSMGGQLNGLSELPLPQNKALIDDRIVLIKCFTEVGKTFVYRDFILDSAQTYLFRNYVPDSLAPEIIQGSEAYAGQLAKAIITWSRNDLYRESRNYPIHSVVDTPGAWLPTAPTYGPAIEPHWGKIRPFIIDSATRDYCDDPIRFSKEKGSEFYKQTAEVQNVVSQADSDKIAIARFWDCNPAPTERHGRVAFNRRQLTPGGHWMGIVRTLALQTNKTKEESAEAYLRCALAVADGFIACWKKKYQCNLIRPESYIKQYIDSKWKPILETPLFPEHPSGHSAISAAAATVLIPIFGDTITYVDSVNQKFGPAPRKFNSLRQAADEAGISRVYGGIHYMLAFQAGKQQGTRIGEFHNSHLNTRKEEMYSTVK